MGVVSVFTGLGKGLIVRNFYGGQRIVFKGESIVIVFVEGVGIGLVGVVACVGVALWSVLFEIKLGRFAHGESKVC